MAAAEETAVGVAAEVAAVGIEQGNCRAFMKKISISRDGKDLGQYAPEEIRGLVMTGELVATDTVLHVPTGDWKPLSSISEFSSLFGVGSALPEESAGSTVVGGDSPSSTPPMQGVDGTAAEELRIIEQIKRWKTQKKSKGCLWTCIGFGLPLFVIMLVMPISDLFGQTAGMLSFFGGLGISVVLAVMGIAKMASAATSMPPGVVPPPGYTNHTSSYSGGTWRSSQGHSGDSGDSGDSGGGGCGGGCGGGD
jgi:hypothetical protein